MLVHKLGHYPTRFHLNGEIPPYTGPEPSLLGKSACIRGGTHPSTYTNLSPHSHTYARDTCKFSSDSDVLVALLRRNPDLCTLGSSTPLDVPLTGVARRIYLLFCVFLGHRVMQNHVGSKVGALSYPISPQRGDSPLYGSRTFASRLDRMYARGDTCKHLYQPLTTLTHICAGHMQVFI